MNPQKYAVTFACYNQVDYTRQCVASMLKHGFDLSRLVVVDNGSSDGTLAYLETLPLGGRIFNDGNLGCGVAWNQGALALQAEWTVVMNNDVLVCKDWIENLITVAEKNNLKIISPSLIEGALDYDFDAFASDAISKMKGALRLGRKDGVCLVIHESVWKEIGYFQPIPKLLGYEDTLFFYEADKAGIPSATTGASLLHHYGSVTQTAMKKERGLAQKQDLGNHRYQNSQLKQNWFLRKLNKVKRRKQTKIWREDELQKYEMTMHGVRVDGEFKWQ
jgi:GT2 family glycosyltransferase